MRITTSLAMVGVFVLGGGAVSTASAVAGTAAPTAAAVAASSGATTTSEAFPPRANSAWVYDTPTTTGAWVSQLRAYDRAATGRHRLTQLYTYGGDVEMYCPDNDPARCTADDLIATYTPTSPGWASTGAYDKAFGSAPGFTLSPIIDGRTDSGGYMQGFTGLSPRLAAAFADKVVAQVCSDPRVDGIQFDIEPFDVTSRNGQFFFYQQVAKAFAGRDIDGTTTDPHHCVDATHPRGRFFSVFTFSSAIRPGTASAANVRSLMTTYGNGYLMDSLYDLSSAPAGTLTSLTDYRAAVNREARTTKAWANRLGIDYGYGIPASASAHEYTTCTAAPDAIDSCVPDASGATGYPMLSYARAAVNAIDATHAATDPAYIGTAVWDFGDHVSWNGLDFTPVPAPASVLHYLSQQLPGSRVGRSPSAS